MKRSAVVLLCIATTLAVPLEQQPSNISVIKDAGLRIVNGKQAVLGQFPWQAGIFIQKQGSSGRWFCGGSLITAEWILTAANWIQNANNFEIYLGVLSWNDPNAVPLITSSYITHESYNPATDENDIALIRLNSPVKLSDTISTIALSGSFLEPGADVTISGWGYTDDGATPISEVLRYVTLTTITNGQCARHSPSFNVTNGMVCALGWAFKNICPGDLGGALVTGTGKGALQVGIASWPQARLCEANNLSGFTRISAYLPWISRWTGTRI